MADRRTSWTNAYETTLSTGMDSSTLTMLVQDAAALAVPCYLVIEPEDPGNREYVYVASKDTNTLTLGERYLAGSGAVSGLSHDSNSTVRSVALAQGFTDLHDRIDALDSTVSTLPHSALTGLTVGDDHPQYLLKTDAATDYAPLAHTHLTVDITDLDWDSLPDKPSTFPPSSHTHPWSQVTDRPASFPSDWSTTANKPSTFPPSSHTHTVSQISNWPSSFPPSAHTHGAGDITSGTLNANRIPNLAASKITSGTFALARIPNIDDGRLPATMSSKTFSGDIIMGSNRLRGLGTHSSEPVITSSASLVRGFGFMSNGNPYLVSESRVAVLSSADGLQLVQPVSTGADRPSWRVGGDGPGYGVWRYTSSARYKTDIADVPVEEATSIIDALRIRSFYTTHEADAGLRIVGAIAEEVYEVEPSLVQLDAEGRPDSLSWSAMIPHLVLTVQDLRSRLNQLEAAGS